MFLMHAPEVPVARRRVQAVKAHPITREELRDLPAGDPRQSKGGHLYYPMAHSYLLDAVYSALESRGVSVLHEQLATTRDGARFFGFLRVSDERSGAASMLGVRNSHDKAFAAALGAGSTVFVCDNLGFSAEYVVSRRNTYYAHRDIHGRVATGIDLAMGEFRRDEARRLHYQATEIGDNTVDLALMNMLRTKALPGSLLGKIVDEYTTPEHAEYGRGTAWTLLQAITHTLRGQSPELVMGRTIQVCRTLDEVAGFSPALN